jgi:hypothetical protein
MELTADQLDLLHAVEEAEKTTPHPSTIHVGRLFLELQRTRGGTASYDVSAPWHGTHPYVDELRDAGLIDVNVGMAKPRRLGDPAGTPDQYWMSLTEAGRQALADHRSG